MLRSKRMAGSLASKTRKKWKTGGVTLPFYALGQGKEPAQHLSIPSNDNLVKRCVPDGLLA